MTWESYIEFKRASTSVCSFYFILKRRIIASFLYIETESSLHVQFLMHFFFNVYSEFNENIFQYCYCRSENKARICNFISGNKFGQQFFWLLLAVAVALALVLTLSKYRSTLMNINSLIANYITLHNANRNSIQTHKTISMIIFIVFIDNSIV